MNEADRGLVFNVETFEIEYSYSMIDEETDDYDDNRQMIDKVSKKDFIIYLAMMFYYFPNIEIINEDRDDVIDVFLSYQQLLNKPKTVKYRLPDW